MNEESIRRSVFEENYKKIVAHNERANNGLHSFRLAVNQFADMTTEEFKQRMNGLRPEMKRQSSVVFDKVNNSLPATVDWRTVGVVTPVKNQGQVILYIILINDHG